ncbi:MAG TPA: type I DNA topoisomerase [Thermoguttaceae bacterium]|nr:type I DNA topoisomerase [Thermoguttaceae bacterium]
MAKKTTAAKGDALVIVESPAKARTIRKFLGRGYTVEASIGHIRDLPQGAKEIPVRFKGEDWAYLGVNVNADFAPVYIVPRDKIKHVRKLKESLKGARELYLATDEDREGEAISWHLCEVLKPTVPVHRLVFHEITEEAIFNALAKPREIDGDLVRAQEVRRIIDRLYGYDVSPLLWRKIKPRLSAGRVQSVAVRLIVERERQRMAFVSATYWDLLGTFAKSNGESFEATLISVDGRKIPAGRDFDPATGKLKDPNLLLLGEQQTAELLSRFQNADCRVANLEDKPYSTRPYPPFTTSTLQQEANRKCGFTARHTMQVAQNLYENGHITYMRTDSTNLAAVAVEAARNLVASQYGKEYLPEKPRTYQTKVKNAQEAHEAIRPAGHPFDFPEKLRSQLSPDEFRLYDLIWKRTVASQMADARGHRITVTVNVDGGVFQVSGKTIEFPGYLRAYVEGSDDPDAKLSDRDEVLPSISVGEALRCRELKPKSHTTSPPNRYSEASLTRALEEMGIGRPSTYAAIIDTILAREYVFKLKRGNVLVPTWTAFAVSQLLEAHLPNLVDYRFTAEMEDELDAISRGEMNHLAYLKSFYFGNGHPGLKEQLKNKTDEIDAREVCQIRIGKPQHDAEAGEEIYVRVGRYGPFLEQGTRRASLPENMPPDELTVQKALEMLDKAAQGDEPLGICPDTHKPVFVKVGRFGPYVQRGTLEDDEMPQNASLLRGMNPEEVDLESALKLLSLPRPLGEHPQSGQPVVAHNGRYGPYVTCGEESRSLPEGLSPLDIALEQAVQILAQPKVGRGTARRKEPIKVFEVSPVTGEKVQLLDGRYGPYVTDGQTNASLPRGTTPEEVTLEYALHLLKTRAEKGPSQRRAAKKTTKKKTVKKKTVKKKTVKKKSTKGTKGTKKSKKKTVKKE